MKIENFKAEYSEEGLKEKLSKIARKAGIKVVYAVLVAYYAVQSDAMSLKDKARLYGALGYFILPVDLIPDSLLGMGYSDDMAALMYVLHVVSDNITPEVKRKAEERLRSWFDVPFEAPEFQISDDWSNEMAALSRLNRHVNAFEK